MAKITSRTLFLHLAAAGLLCLLAVLAPSSTYAAAPPGLAEAIEAQRSLIEEEPRDAALLNDLGNLLVLAGDFEEAEEAYRQTLELDPERVPARFNLALLLQQSGRRRPAKRAFEAVLKIDPDHAWGHYQLGQLLAEAGNRRAAVRHYSRAFLLEPRLTLADFNPHILDNELAIQATLRAYSEDSAADLTPRQYQHPGQIRALLIPGIPEEEAEEEAQEESQLAESEAAASDDESRRLGPENIEPGSGRTNQISGGGPQSGKKSRASKRRDRANRKNQPGAIPDRRANRQSPSPTVTPRPPVWGAGRAAPEERGAAPGQPPATEPDGAGAAGPGVSEELPENVPGGGRDLDSGRGDLPDGGPVDDPGPGDGYEPPDPDYEPDVFSTGRLELRLIPAKATKVASLPRVSRSDP